MATITHTQKVYRANVAYIIVLLVVTILAFFFGIFGALCALHINAPDRFDPVVGQTYDNPTVEEFRGGSTQDWKDRANKLKNLIVRLGDVKGVQEQTGRIGLTTGSTRPLVKGGRVYE
ncbi:hypothetical protein F4779DRAFT_643873 [Xylariaceae sp. FL0662B]|nr:hypothetical protein F4779DRAFT_643873 [Xylariaceae sp. FL0662B]